MTSLVIVTPTHTDSISSLEEQRLKLSLSLNEGVSHMFVVPDSLRINELSKKFPNSTFHKFSDDFFTSKYKYNSLLLNSNFYEKFLDFDYILLCQFDSIIIRNVKSILKFNFIYLGASWNPSFYIREFFGHIYTNRTYLPFGKLHELQSGNGGLSLRNPNQINQILKSAHKSLFFQKIIGESRNINEDILTVFILKKFGIPPIEKNIANKFFIETALRSEYKLNEVYGFHQLHRYDRDLESTLLNSFKFD
jgi:hypothetical protein